MNLSGLSGSETIYARAALAGGFLTSVTDRFGLWGPAGRRTFGKSQRLAYAPAVIF